MKILVIGGTQFVGRAIVELLVANGDEVTLFHRGRTNPDLFPSAAHLLGDRNDDLSALASGEWDATIDPSAYFPRQVHALAEALGSRGGRYVHISSVSAYATLTTSGANEDAALAQLEDPTAEVVTGATYGGLKALCEVAAIEEFGPGGRSWSGQPVSIVRPTYVAGPYDHTGRFTWWVQRAARGGRILAPGPRDNPFQSIDVRDVARFVVSLAYGQAGGTFHVSGPVPPFTFEDFLTLAVDEVGAPNAELVWVDAARLNEAGVTPGDLPLWEGLDEDRLVLRVDSSRAIGAGLTLRPLRETIRDVYEHEERTPTAVRQTVGLSPSREGELLNELA
ncbi:MAG: NAD-dependent epimerase/dehydratase family protein [Acidimicrobiales bacterium]